MRVRFLRDYDYTPSAERRVTIAYRAGSEHTVKREAGEAAVSAGAAREVRKARSRPTAAQADETA